MLRFCRKRSDVLALVLVLVLSSAVSFTDASGSSSNSGGASSSYNASGSGFVAVPGGNNTGNIIDTYDEVDITMLAFSQQKLATYINALAAAANVPLSRIYPSRIDNTIALEFGWQYIFPIRVLPPTNVGTDTESATIVAARVEALLNHPDKKTIHGEIYRSTMISGRRVKVVFRQRVEIKQGVNYVWVAFLILGLIMLVFAVAVVLRPRGADADTLLEDDDSDEEMYELPDVDLMEKAELRQEEGILAGHEKQLDRHFDHLRQRGGETKKTLKMMDATLEYDHQWSLPMEWHEIEAIKRRKAERELEAKRAEGGGALDKQSDGSGRSSGDNKAKSNNNDDGGSSKPTDPLAATLTPTPLAANSPGGSPDPKPPAGAVPISGAGAAKTAAPLPDLAAPPVKEQPSLVEPPKPRSNMRKYANVDSDDDL